jgi:DNA-binding NarL/FixJ family response regulator
MKATYRNASKEDSPDPIPPARPFGRRHILLVEDHPVVSKGLAGLINYEQDMEVCGTAQDGPTAIQQIETLKPDLVILDLGLKGRNGLDVLKDIKARMPRQRVLVLSMHDELLYAPRAIRAGASGYIMKQEATETLFMAIREVLMGGTYVSSNVGKKLMQRFVRNSPSPFLDPLEGLTDRELDVFRLIGQGKSTREIAQQLCLSAKTIESHRLQIKMKLNLKTVAEVVRRAIQVDHEEQNSGSGATPPTS